MSLLEYLAKLAVVSASIKEGFQPWSLAQPAVESDVTSIASEGGSALRNVSIVLSKPPAVTQNPFARMHIYSYHLSPFLYHCYPAGNTTIKFIYYNIFIFKRLADMRSPLTTLNVYAVLPPYAMLSSLVHGAMDSGPDLALSVNLIGVPLPNRGPETHRSCHLPRNTLDMGAGLENPFEY